MDSLRTGSSRCTSTGSASIWQVPSRGNYKPSSTRRVLRHHSSGPDHLAGEAHRRAMGFGRGGTRSETSMSGGRNGTAGIATRSGASGDLIAASSLSSQRASPVAAISTTTAAPATRQRELRHVSRRLHAARPRQLQPEDNEANLEATATARTTTTASTTGRGTNSDPKIRAVRERQKRNFLATVFCHWACQCCTPGELGRTQRGNNNAYARTTRSAGSIGSDPSAGRLLRSEVRDRVTRDQPCSSDAFLSGRSTMKGPKASPGSHRTAVRCLTRPGTTRRAHPRLGWRHADRETDEQGNPIVGDSFSSCSAPR